MEIGGTNTGASTYAMKKAMKLPDTAAVTGNGNIIDITA